MINIQQGMSPQLYMSMHGLNNLFNNNVRHQRPRQQLNINDNATTQQQLDYAICIWYQSGHQALNIIWMIIHSTGHQALNLLWMIYIQQGIKPPT